ncbi:MerR family transcriptional regulator [Prescottella equi]|uniref:MerR family transcriptional regulator n=1 Tax=Rhodococcus hoagii TaxID=43767 RepID=UPI00197D53B3|nr:helix-turn-helix domain-containing protein [Prescottella equi]MBM4708699.1 MerR family DNA-binding transcriptional regulator [Prescottella equi]MBM4711053.1 MerR family DNA-binding transcriptional regulator [Prescottella equi]NKS67305.1 MerR family DNA-binding transcriptional regulator [Prescottella equi]NKU15244.1 MerR family DNA-binding transcriptional regulator [Prescottella equi]NKU15282.1 MerR family DNA-binding transcriptional regulator [Prescottella equi]
MQTKHASPEEEYLPVGEAAALVGVSTDTLKRWEKAGRISSRRTPTGHRRFARTDVLALLAS